MSTETKLRRGTAAQCDAMTPAEGELVVDLTNDRTRLGDGAKLGGFHQASAADVQRQNFVYATAGGTANAITLTPGVGLSSYSNGCSFEFRAAADNTGATTIAVSGLSAISIQKVSSGVLTSLTAGDIKNGIVYRVTYNGTSFQLIGAGTGSVVSITAGDGLSGGTITASGTISINTNNSLGVGAYAILLNQTGSTISNGNTAAGSLLRAIGWSTSGQATIPANGISGTWRNVSGETLSAQSTTQPCIGLFVRVA